MRLTSSYSVFRADPGEEALAKARWYGREGQIDSAEREYRTALRQHPDLTTGWVELFELQRGDGRPEHALTTAEAAEKHFGPQAAVPLALKGAALSELGRVREAVAALEGALERDGHLALAWHELAHAAYRVGEYARALLALDRAFALEPHTDTLMLRGRILRDAGQYEAALVAFDGAWQSAEHEPQRRDAERETAATRRAATFTGRRMRQLSPREKLFVTLGAVIIEPEPEPGPGGLARSIAAAPAIARAAGWHPAAVAPLSPADEPLAEALAQALGVPRVALAAVDPADQPLLVTAFLGGGEEWLKQLARLQRWHAGTTFALVQGARVTDAADLVGALGAHDGVMVYAALEDALAQARTIGPADPAAAADLLANPEAPWRRRLHADGALVPQ